MRGMEENFSQFVEDYVIKWFGSKPREFRSRDDYLAQVNAAIKEAREAERKSNNSLDAPG